MFKKIRNRIGAYMLARETAGKQRGKSQMNFADANYIGIIFDATNPDNFDLVKKYINYLKEYKKKVRSIGYFNLKEVPADQVSKLEYDFISRKDLNWYFFPSGVNVSNFTKEEFDVLINFDVEDSLALHYLSAFSAARFKTARLSEKYLRYYDMTIDTGENTGLKFLMRHMDTYLNMVNRKQNSSS